jgi:hypothetical protein
MTRSISCLVLLVATGLAAGCYNTKKVQSGGLTCSPDPSKRCPDGFFCDEGDNRCYRNGTEGSNVCKAAQAQPPFGPLSACSASTEAVEVCDPVCQRGCACNQRCQLVGDADGNFGFACQEPPTGTLLDDFKPCDTNNVLCKPGLDCFRPPRDSTGCVNQCIRYCREDRDCPLSSSCLYAVDNIGQQSVAICSSPAVNCNPVMNTAAPACSNSLNGPNCYVFSNDHPDETMCDCAGTAKAGAICTDLHSCVAGHECVDGKCQKMCLLQTGGVVCAAGQTCVALHGTSTKYGTCQ